MRMFLFKQNILSGNKIILIPIWKTMLLFGGGSPDDIFQNKLLFFTGQSGYVTKKIGLPDQSRILAVWYGFELTILSDKKHLFYFGENVPKIFAFSLRRI